jgi:hypothetical protein
VSRQRSRGQTRFQVFSGPWSDPTRPRPADSFTVRRMMAAVAVMAVLLTATDRLRRRRESFEQRARECARRVSSAYQDEQAARVGNRFHVDPRTTTAYYQLVEHFDALRVKYEQAAARP